LQAPPLVEAGNDPESNAFWGVDSSATVEVPGYGSVERSIFKFVANGVEYELYRHPMLFISEEIMAWNNEYEFLGKSSPNISYSETNPCFHSACAIYENYLQRFRKK
jgi:hypothetical protein